MPEVTMFEALAKLGVGGILAAVLLFLHVRQLKVFSRALRALKQIRTRDRKECHEEIMALAAQMRDIQGQVLSLAKAIHHFASKEGGHEAEGG